MRFTRDKGRQVAKPCDRDRHHDQANTHTYTQTHMPTHTHICTANIARITKECKIEKEQIFPEVFPTTGGQRKRMNDGRNSSPVRATQAQIDWGEAMNNIITKYCEFHAIQSKTTHTPLQEHKLLPSYFVQLLMLSDSTLPPDALLSRETLEILLPLIKVFSSRRSTSLPLSAV